MPRRTHALALAAAIGSLVPMTAHAQRAAYARPEDLPSEGFPMVLDVSAQGRYARVLDPARVAGLSDMGSFALRSRMLIGRTVGYVVGFDGEIGGGTNGPVYGATLHFAGVGARWGLANVVALGVGAGLDGVEDSVPLAGRFPVQLSLGWSLGPVRLDAHAAVAWVVGPAERRGESSWLPFGDEFDAGLRVRLGRQRRYWSTMNAGGGPALGVVYREFMGTRSLGLVLSIDLTGAR